jgi:hypothetical protein
MPAEPRPTVGFVHDIEGGPGVVHAHGGGQPSQAGHKGAAELVGAVAADARRPVESVCFLRLLVQLGDEALTRDQCVDVAVVVNLQWSSISTCHWPDAAATPPFDGHGQQMAPPALP